ncbi:MAG: hypothetical protein A2Z83_01515, partial [Omnitrophica bacterium GWA2_52_8]
DIRKDFVTAQERLQVLKGVNFSFQPHEMAFILGRSGSGKSTLLHLFGGLDQPTSGKIMFEGRDLVRTPERKLASLRNKRLGFVFQFYHLLPELTVYENVTLPARIARSRVDHVWATELLRRMHLTDRKNYMPVKLSGGEQQRVAIARALMNRPAVVFCDEPTGNLDAETSETVLALLTELNEREGQAFIIVTHDEVLAWRFDHVYRLVDGILMRDHHGHVGVKSAQ